MTDAAQSSPLTGALLTDNPLSVTHRRELADARDRAKTIRKAASIAGFNGWTTAAAAACSAMFLVFDRSPIAIAVTIALVIVTFNEFRGRKRLLNFDTTAATMMGWNQLGLLAMIVVYCLWSLSGMAGQADAMRAELKSYSDLDAALGTGPGFEGMVKTISYAFYGGVIALSLVFQGGNALYYFTRRRHVEEFIVETPQWVRDVQGGSVPV